MYNYFFKNTFLISKIFIILSNSDNFLSITAFLDLIEKVPRYCVLTGNLFNMYIRCFCVSYNFSNMALLSSSSNLKLPFGQVFSSATSLSYSFSTFSLNLNSCKLSKINYILFWYFPVEFMKERFVL